MKTLRMNLLTAVDRMLVAGISNRDRDHRSAQHGVT